MPPRNRVEPDRPVSNVESVEARHGGCLCGAVRYRVDGPLRGVVNCHCSQCRRTSGHFVAATAARKDDLTVTVTTGLRWYRSSEKARRGFCGTCGSSLFWEADSGERIAIMVGTLDAPTGLRTVAHIFVADAGDYYDLDDDLEKLAAGSYGETLPLGRSDG